MTLNEKIDDLTAKYQALSDKLDAMTPASALAKMSHAKPPSPARKKASSENGKKGGRPASRYYALHWSCGSGCQAANGGGDIGIIYSYSSAALRDRHCSEFRAPNHCPSACIEPITAAQARVRDHEARVLVRVEAEGKEPIERFDPAAWYENPLPGNCYEGDGSEITIIG